MAKPKPLAAGSVVRLVSPASPVGEDKLKNITGLLERLGFSVQVGAHALDSADYLAGSDEDRARDLTDAFLDPNADAVLCTRGGYGCARLLPYLDVPSLAQSAKLFMGFSDITTLHLALNACGLPTVHSPMALTLHFEREPWVVESFERVLKNDVSVPVSAPVGETLVPGTATGIVTGGCLCLLADSIGTPFPLSAEGKIVLIEDVDENPHRVDAMLTHLLNAGIIQGAAGIVVGEMTRTDEKIDEGIGGRPWRTIVSERLKPLGIPLILNYPFGHAKNMLTLPLGIQAELDADAGTLRYLEPLCC